MTTKATGTKATKATKLCRHGFASGTCATCVAKARKARKADGDDTLATTTVEVRIADGIIPTAPKDGRTGVRALIADGTEQTAQDLRGSLTFTPEDSFGTVVVPAAALVAIGGLTATGRARKGATLAAISLDVLRNGDGLAIGREGREEMEHDGRPYVAHVRIRVQGSGAWYVSADVRPGRLPKGNHTTAAKRAATAGTVRRVK